MNNLITIYMNYKVDRLIEYGTLIYEDSKFIREVFKGYFDTYIDNYYYGIFNTVDTDTYSLETLQVELNGVMSDMMDDYRNYELRVSNAEFAENMKIIRDLRDVSFEIIKLDDLNSTDREDLESRVSTIVNESSILNDLIGNRLSKLVTLVKETNTNSNKLLNYEDEFYSLEKKKFISSEIEYISLKWDIRILDNYKRVMINRIFNDKKFEVKKLKCLIQKVSLYLLKKVLNKEEIKPIFIDLYDSSISRGIISREIYLLIDNPLFRKYVIMGVNYTNYLAHKDAFSEDFQFACIQDFSHINDIYKKVEDIYKEGIFNYLLVLKYRDRERDYFVNYEAEGLKLLVFEEE
ncbi:MAG: hypothetical protein IJI22_03540 [Bacilli bacterium]|nr:hypothetical protein [Bacilli bacterium]